MSLNTSLNKAACAHAGDAGCELITRHQSEESVFASSASSGWLEQPHRKSARHFDLHRASFSQAHLKNENTVEVAQTLVNSCSC